MDIRPETILFENDKWFILDGELSFKNVSEFGSSLNKPAFPKSADRKYLSPLSAEALIKNDSALLHNPYKSDVYSLGLVLL